MGLEDNYQKAVIQLSRNKDLQNAIIDLSRYLPLLTEELKNVRQAMDRMPRR